MHFLDAGRRLIPVGFFRILYPALCEGCGARIHEKEMPLCRRCLRTLDRVPEERIEHRLARFRADSGPVFQSAFSLWTLDPGGPLYHVQHRLKYGNRPLYAERLGRIIGQALLRESHPALCCDLIVPVPLHRARLYERGYNQSAMLARGIAGVLQLSMEEKVVTRIRATLSQTHLGRAERRLNVQGAFRVNDPDPVVGRNILLVDDLLTTGATVTAAARSLCEAGVAGVHLCTLAMVRE